MLVVRLRPVFEGGTATPAGQTSPPSFILRILPLLCPIKATTIGRLGGCLDSLPMLRGGSRSYLTCAVQWCGYESGVIHAFELSLLKVSATLTPDD